MDLKSGYPFWTVKNGLPCIFPPMLDDADCDVAIIGAGITGTLIADKLAQAGFDVVVLDKRDVAWGSTAASTALLQYEIDIDLTTLAKHFGDENAVMAYRACEQAVQELGEVAARAGDVGFQRMRSLYLASVARHARRVRAEGEFRQHHGFDLNILDRNELREKFGIHAPLALLTPIAAEVDPYRLTYATLQRLQTKGVRVFDRSGVLDWRANERGITVRVERDVVVRCKHLIIAAGYESQQYLRRKVAANHSSYAFVSEPLNDGLGALRDTLLWESARPYLYLRTTSDGRLLVGGEDDRVDIPSKRDAMVAKKSVRLQKKLKKFLPALELSIGFAWAGTFAETPDGLPYFGPHPQHDQRVHFAMAYGGNGIAFSHIGAAILLDRLRHTTHPLARLFSFERIG